MQHFGPTAALLACLAMGALPGCASTAPGRGVAEIVDDAAITAGV